MKIKEKKLLGIAILLTFILVTASGAYLTYRAWDYWSADRAYEDMGRSAVQSVKITDKPDRDEETTKSEKRDDLEGEGGPDDSAGQNNSDEIYPAETIDGVAIPDKPVVDWSKLTKSGKDIVAWINIPAMEIAYPVVQGDDNEFYLHHLPNGEYKNAGSLFMEAANAPDLTDINTVIYGHNMDNGSMFGRFRNMTEEDYRQQPFLWLCTKEKACLYAMISMHISHVDDESYSLFKIDGSTESLLSGRDETADGMPALSVESNSYRSNDEGADVSFTEDVDTKVTRWIRNENQRSYINMPIPRSAYGRIITLSTCASYSDERRVLQAILIREYTP